MALDLGTLRQDGAGYVEGYETAGFIINKSILEKTLWIPGVTYTPAELTDAGTMNFPIIEKLTSGGETELCEDGLAGTVGASYETLQITSKVTAEFEGCFTVAGIADGKFSKAMNNLKMKIMAEDFNKAIYDRALASATESAIDAWSGEAGDGSAYTYVKKRRREFKELNGSVPNFGFLSEDLYEALEADLENRQTNLGDNTILNGLGNELDSFTWRKTTYIVSDREEDLVFGSKETNFIATPKKPKQLGALMNGIDMSGLETSFTKGLLSITAIGNHLNPASIKTGVHKPFGHGVVAKITFTKPKAPVTLPETRTRKKAKDAE